MELGAYSYMRIFKYDTCSSQYDKIVNIDMTSINVCWKDIVCSDAKDK